MKGTLAKTKQGWVVEYMVYERTPIGHKSYLETIPLHPQDELKMVMIEGKEVHFDIVTTSSSTYFDKKVAKLINTMKIKLQEYSLISNEWIDEHIRHLKYSLDHIPESYITKHQAQIYILEQLKQQLIPSEKLADLSFDKGYNCLSLRKLKQDFLTSEIEISN